MVILMTFTSFAWVLVTYLLLLDVDNAAELEFDTKLELGLDETLLLIDDDAIGFGPRLDEVVLLVAVETVKVEEALFVNEVLVVKLVVAIVVKVGAAILVIKVVLLIKVVMLLVVLVALPVLVVLVVEVDLVEEVLIEVAEVEELELTLFVVEVVLVVRLVLVIEVVLEVRAVNVNVVMPCTKQPPVTEGTALAPVEIGIMFAVTDPVQVAA
jgi:hypothetical protein